MFSTKWAKCSVLKWKHFFCKTDCNQNKMQWQGFLPCLKISSCKTWNEKLCKINSRAMSDLLPKKKRYLGLFFINDTLDLRIYSSLWHQTVLKNTEETPENLILCPIFSYIGKTDSITISIWNHKKIHKRQGAGFLGCIRLLSNAISRLKDTGCKSLFFYTFKYTWLYTCSWEKFSINCISFLLLQTSV